MVVHLCRVKRRADSDAEDSEAAGQKRPKKTPAYKYTVDDDTAILRAFARSAPHPLFFMGFLKDPACVDYQSVISSDGRAPHLQRAAYWFEPITFRQIEQVFEEKIHSTSVSKASVSATQDVLGGRSLGVEAELHCQLYVHMLLMTLVSSLGSASSCDVRMYASHHVSANLAHGILCAVVIPKASVLGFANITMQPDVKSLVLQLLHLYASLFVVTYLACSLLCCLCLYCFTKAHLHMLHQPFLLS